jgi:hypothetical protein
LDACPQIRRIDADEAFFFSLEHRVNREIREIREPRMLPGNGLDFRVFGVFRGSRNFLFEQKSAEETVFLPLPSSAEIDRPL